MPKKKNITIDNLAVLVARSFNDLEKRLDLRFDRIESQLNDLSKRVINIEKDIIWIKEILDPFMITFA